MRADTINKISLGILIISVILLLSMAMSNAQSTFYNPFYYTGSYISPISPVPYPFFPLYDPLFPAYNSVPVLPLYNPAYFNPVHFLAEANCLRNHGRGGKTIKNMAHCFGVSRYMRSRESLPDSINVAITKGYVVVRK